VKNGIDVVKREASGAPVNDKTQPASVDNDVHHEAEIAEVMVS
jgi:hypothetical protein